MFVHPTDIFHSCFPKLLFAWVMHLTPVFDSISVATLVTHHFQSPMKFNQLSQLIRFLQDDLRIPPNAIALVMRQDELSINTFPMLLWKYGLIDLQQLDQIFDWIETA